MGATARIAAEGHVLTAGGRFDVHQAPVDLSIDDFDDGIAFGSCSALALEIFHQFFRRYALNDSAARTEEIARDLLCCNAFQGRDDVC